MTGVAAYHEPSPAWDAVITQVPPATKVTVAVVVVPERVPVATVQIPLLLVLNEINRLELVLAEILLVPAERRTSVGLANVMV